MAFTPFKSIIIGYRSFLDIFPLKTYPQIKNMPTKNKRNLPSRLKTTAKLSDEQIETIMDWLSNNEQKKVSFSLMLESKIEMPLNRGIVNRDQNLDIQEWAWTQIKQWISAQEND